MYSITFGAGLLLLVIGIFLFSDRMAFIKNGIVTVATVIELKEKVDSDSDKKYTPIFRFTTHNKEEIIYEYNVSTDPPAWSIGEETKVVYHKKLPHEVVLLTYFGSFGAVLILLSLALVCFSIAGGYYWSRNFFNSLTYLPPINLS
ncbi:MAG TPA: DUF3592 domain-containing protein [Niastella sp.]